MTRSNQVWATDLTYIPVAGGFVHLCAVIDWHSRYILAWELSNTLDASFCVRPVRRAITAHGVPEIFNTDQGCQFTSVEFAQPPLALGLRLSMDGKGRCLDNVFVKRLWRSLKHQEVCLKRYESVPASPSTKTAVRTPHTATPPQRSLPRPPPNRASHLTAPLPKFTFRQ